MNAICHPKKAFGCAKCLFVLAILVFVALHLVAASGEGFSDGYDTELGEGREPTPARSRGREERSPSRSPSRSSRSSAGGSSSQHRGERRSDQSRPDRESRGKEKSQAAGLEALDSEMRELKIKDGEPADQEERRRSRSRSGSRSGGRSRSRSRSGSRSGGRSRSRSRSGSRSGSRSRSRSGSGSRLSPADRAERKKCDQILHAADRWMKEANFSKEEAKLVLDFLAEFKSKMRNVEATEREMRLFAKIGRMLVHSMKKKVWENGSEIEQFRLKVGLIEGVEDKLVEICERLKKFGLKLDKRDQDKLYHWFNFCDGFFSMRSKIKKDRKEKELLEQDTLKKALEATDNQGEWKTQKHLKFREELEEKEQREQAKKSGGGGSNQSSSSSSSSSSSRKSSSSSSSSSSSRKSSSSSSRNSAPSNSNSPPSDQPKQSHKARPKSSWGQNRFGDPGQGGKGGSRGHRS